MNPVEQAVARIKELEAEVERLTKLHETIASWDFVAKAYQKVYFEDFPTATLQRARMGSFCGRNWELEAEVERSK